MKLRLAASMAALSLSLGIAHADALEQAKSRFEAEFEGIQVEEALATPFEGIIELRLPGNELLYTNKDLDFVMQGSLIDVASRTDLTAQRVEELNRVDFAEMPLDKAIKTVKGDGTQKIAVFEDPNCIYCKRLHESLEDIDNITVYSFLFPILTPESRIISEHVWCADDASAAWNDLMKKGVTPAEKTCDNPIDEVLKFGMQQGVQGTPAIFFEDGSRANGFLPAEQLKARLDAATKATQGG